MLFKRTLFFGLLIVMILSVSASGQAMYKHARLELRGGMFSLGTDETDFISEGTELSAESSGIKTGVGFYYYFKEHMAFAFNLDMLLNKVDAKLGTYRRYCICSPD